MVLLENSGSAFADLTAPAETGSSRRQGPIFNRQIHILQLQKIELSWTGLNLTDTVKSCVWLVHNCCIRVYPVEKGQVEVWTQTSGLSLTLPVLSGRWPWFLNSVHA